MAQWEKGTSGNPNGRPPNSKNDIPSNETMRDEYRKASKKALRKLLQIMSSGSESGQLKAAVKIVDMDYNLMVKEDKLIMKTTSGEDTPSEGDQKDTKAKVIPIAR